MQLHVHSFEEVVDCSKESVFALDSLFLYEILGASEIESSLMLRVNSGIYVELPSQL